MPQPNGVHSPSPSGKPPRAHDAHSSNHNGIDYRETICSSLIDVDRRFPARFLQMGQPVASIELRRSFSGFCFYDKHPFDGIPVPLVKGYRCDIIESFEITYRVAFCSPSCHLAHLNLQNSHDARSNVLALKCFMVMVMKDSTEYAPALPLSMLKCFSPDEGVFDNIDDFRKACRFATYVERQFPTIPHSIVYEERITVQQPPRIGPGASSDAQLDDEDTESEVVDTPFLPSSRFVMPVNQPFRIRGRKMPSANRGGRKQHASTTVSRRQPSNDRRPGELSDGRTDGAQLLDDDDDGAQATTNLDEQKSPAVDVDAEQDTPPGRRRECLFASFVAEMATSTTAVNDLMMADASLVYQGEPGLDQLQTTDAPIASGVPTEPSDASQTDSPLAASPLDDVPTSNDAPTSDAVALSDASQPVKAPRKRGAAGVSTTPDQPPTKAPRSSTSAAPRKRKTNKKASATDASEVEEV